MNEYISIIEKSWLFKNLNNNEIEKAISFLNGQTVFYKKGQYVFNYGDYIKKIGLVLSGWVRIQKEDYYGNRSITTDILKGDIFGEVYIFQNKTSANISAFCVEDTKILLLDILKLIKSEGESTDILRQKLNVNIIQILAYKAYALNKKIEHITKRTTREKLMSFFSEQAENAGKSSFDISFNRQELADFICVDRSAMSNELGKMKKEGIIDYNKNHFELLKNKYDK